MTGGEQTRLVLFTDGMIAVGELLHIADKLNREGNDLTAVLQISFDQDDFKERELCDFIAAKLIELSRIRNLRHTKISGA